MAHIPKSPTVQDGDLEISVEEVVNCFAGAIGKPLRGASDAGYAGSGGGRRRGEKGKGTLGGCNGGNLA